MKYYVFCERGLMLPETAAQDIEVDPQIRLIQFDVTKVPGYLTRLYQWLHLITRPFSLSISAYFALRFNTRLAAPLRMLNEAALPIEQDDVVLFLNPRLATAPVVDVLNLRAHRVNLYFFDPIHRLGLTERQLKKWRASCRLLTYSATESTDHQMEFLEPYAPTVNRQTEPAFYDLAYVGSPSPKRLIWLLYLNIRIATSGRKGYLRLATQQSRLIRILPWLFCRRLSFADYIELCRRSRGILELHERDAEGVTLRATLCRALGRSHLCNLRTTSTTIQISPIWNGELTTFLVHRSDSQSLRPDAIREYAKFDHWLRVNFNSTTSSRRASDLINSNES